MNRPHEHVLADIEQHVHAAGVPLEDVDSVVAATLGVPVEYYFTYLLVWGAIEAQRHMVHVSDQRPEISVTEPGLDLAASLVDEIGRLAASIHDDQDAVRSTSLSARVLGCVLELRQLLRDLRPLPWLQSGQAETVVEVRGSD